MNYTIANCMNRDLQPRLIRALDVRIHPGGIHEVGAGETAVARLAGEGRIHPGGRRSQSRIRKGFQIANPEQRAACRSSLMMEYQPKLTRHQTARGTRPDGARGHEWILVKDVSLMRLTYQIKLLTYFASQKRLTLSVYVPGDAEVHADLRAFCAENCAHLRIVH
jgi:hypothetical protein